MGTTTTVLVTSSLFDRLLGRSDGETDQSDAPSAIADRIGWNGSLEDAEVIGRSPLSYVAAGESVSSFVGKEIASKLGQYGLEDIEPEEWYPLAIPLAMLYDMRDEYGDVRMRNMGQNVPQHVEFPPELSEVDDALRAIDQAYHQNHSGEHIGSYEFEAGDEYGGTMTCETPYPCEFDKGLIKGVAKKFANNPVRVEEIGEQCRSEEGQRCVYRVEWY